MNFLEHNYGQWQSVKLSWMLTPRVHVFLLRFTEHAHAVENADFLAGSSTVSPGALILHYAWCRYYDPLQVDSSLGFMVGPNMLFHVEFPAHRIVTVWTLVK